MSVETQKTALKQVLDTIFDLKPSQTYQLSLDDYNVLKNREAVVAYFVIGDGERLSWYIIAQNNAVYLVDRERQVNTLLARMNPDTEELTFASNLEDVMQDILLRSTSTLGAVINNIISSTFFNALEMSDEYYEVYPNVSDYFGEFYVKFGDSEPHRIDDPAISQIMNKSITNIDSIALDIFGKQQTSMVPLFHVTIDDGILAFGRYTNQQERGYTANFPSKDDADAVVTPTKQKNASLMSNTVHREHIDKLINNSSESHDYLREWIEKSVKSFTKVDKIQGMNSFEPGHRVILGKIDTIKWLAQNPEIIEKNGLKTATKFAIDKFPTIYTPHSGTIHLGISESTLRTVQLTYSVDGIGTIIEIHIKPDPKFITNPRDLSDPRNFFVISNQNYVVIQYNTGNKTLAAAKVSQNVAFVVAWRMIVIALGIKDVYDVAQMCTTKARGSAATELDTYGATVMYNMTLHGEYKENPVAKVTVSSRTNQSDVKNDNVVDARRMLIEMTTNFEDKVLECKTNVIQYVQNTTESGETEVTPETATKLYTYGNGESIYDEAKEDLLLTSKAKKLRVAAPNPSDCLGAVMHRQIENHINKGVTEMERQLNLGKTNTLSRINSAVRFQPGSPLGKALIGVRNAIINTFSPLVGTDARPGIFTKFNIKADDYHNVSKFITVNGSSTPVPVMAEMRIDNGYAGIFSVARAADGTPVVYASFPGDAYRAVGKFAGTPEAPELSDEFLQWYLVQCFEDNTLAKDIAMTLDNPEDEDAARIPPRIAKFFEREEEPQEVEEQEVPEELDFDHAHDPADKSSYEPEEELT